MSWSNVALSTLVDIKGGGTPSKANPEYWNGSIPWASVKDFKSSDLNGASDYITQEGIDNSATSLIPRGNLIVPTRMALGKIAINSVDIAINQDLKALIIKDESVVDTEYLFRCIQSKSEEIVRQGKGATVKGITVDVLKNLQIPLPPLETQKQIAKVLEQADQLRKDCKLLEQELNSLAQSVFIDMFGDQLTSSHEVLGNVSNVVSGVTKGQKHNNKVIVKVPYMRVANVQAGYLNLNEIKEIEVKESDVEKYKLEVGDVLLTEGGDHDKLGRGAIWNGEVDNCIHQNHVFRVRLNTELYTSQWFNGYLKTDFAKRYFLKCAKKTTNLASINITQLKGLPMPNVDIKEQVRFEKIMTSINSKIISNAELAHEYDENFNALMQKAFKGELNL
ncbi:restriction endonuclease subunit S [Vibrio fluvialis]|nr:restriction endonuclease subunit S [Vibrio fluvialis]